MSSELIPVSAVVPTRNRAASFRRMLESLAQQSSQALEIICIDASDDSATKEVVDAVFGGLQSHLVWKKAAVIGAATQRNQGVGAATQPFVWFFDDDIRFEPNCVQRLWNAINSDRQLGGVNAMIINQRYQTPGAISQLMFTLMHGRAGESFAGKVIGPAINLLPEDSAYLPEVVPVEWLNTTCTIYRRETLPDPPFDEYFTGYSMMEDVALSLRATQAGWKLANVRTARIFHNSQTADYKSEVSARGAMELQNRHYIMSKILRKDRFTDYLRLALWELFSIASTCTSPIGRRTLPRLIAGKFRAACRLRVQ